MNFPLCLESPQALSEKIRERLNRHRDLFFAHKYVEAVLENEEVRDIANDIESHLIQHRLRAYHCTKEPFSNFFRTRGLRPTNVKSHQAEFLEMFGDKFTSDELGRMRCAWQEYFERGGQRKMRDGFVWTCLSRSLVQSQGTDTFFRYFGGESIFMPLLNDAAIASKLQLIGSPVVVEVSIPGELIRANYKMSTAILSLYHISIRDDAHPFESEAHICQAVPPEDVLCVTPFDNFTL